MLEALHPKIHQRKWSLQIKRKPLEHVQGTFLIYWFHFGYWKTFHICSSGVHGFSFKKKNKKTKGFSFPRCLCFWTKFATRRNSLTSMDSQTAAAKVGTEDTSVCSPARRRLQPLSCPLTSQKLPRVARHTKKTGRCSWTGKDPPWGGQCFCCL